MLENNYVLEMKNISKRFPGVKALNDISLFVRKGEVHALMGENGAGKSTLMKILCGLYKQDGGDIFIKGEKVSINSPSDAIKLGISMIHQELNLVPEMTIAENIFLGREASYAKTGLVNFKELKKRTGSLLQNLGIDLSPDVKLKELTVAGAQMVEITKAVSYKAEIIIMDEPTSAISEREVKKLFNIIKSLTQKGVSIIYISHRMEEIFTVSDYITVLRDGNYIGTSPAKQLDNTKLISMMVGRELNEIFPKGECKKGNAILKVENLSCKGSFTDVSFKVHEGEILGFAGLMGAGRTEIAETIFGIRKKTGGQLFLDGKEVVINSPEDAIRNGLGLVPEDRKNIGLNLIGSVKNNMAITIIKRLNRGIFVKEGNLNSVVDKHISTMSIKTPNRDQKVESLSGGNQQKVVLVKWLLTNPKILILDEPTRGIDIGAKTEIHGLMNNLAAQGMAIIMISSELPEVIGMSDRILVFSEGKLTGELMRTEASQEKVMKYATPKKGV